MVEINRGVPFPNLLLSEEIAVLMAPPLNHLEDLLAIGEECAARGTVESMHETVIDVE